MNTILRSGIHLFILAAALSGGLCCPGQTSRGGFGSTNPVQSQATRDGMARASQERQLLRSSGIITVHLHAAIYEVQAPADRLGALGGKALAGKAATDETLFNALRESGQARVLYRFDQPINVYSGTILFGGSEPLMRVAQISADGPQINSVSYVNMGAILRFSAQMPTNEIKRALPDVTLNLRLSGFVQTDSGSGTNRDTDESQAAIRAVNLENTGPLEFDRPMVASARSVKSADGKPAAPIGYVIRYVFDKPGPQSRPQTEASAEKKQQPQTGNVTTNEWVRGFSVTNVPARFQATIYQLDAMPVRLDALNATALAANATTDEAFLKSLSEIGKARILYQIDKIVNACSEQIQISTNQDLVTGVRQSPDGRMVSSRVQTRAGVLVDVSSQLIPKGMPGEGPAVTASVLLSCLTPSELDFAPGVPATSTRTLQVEDTEPFRFNQPRVFVAARSIYSREQEAPVVYIIRYQFSAPAGP